MTNVGSPGLRDRALVVFAAFMVAWATASAAAASPQEPQRDDRPGSAAAPGGELERRVREERDRASSFRDELDRIGAGLQAARQRQRTLAQQALDRASDLTLRLREAEPGSLPVDAVYDEVVADLVEARPVLSRALDIWGTRSSVPEYRPTIDPASLEGTPLADEAVALRGIHREIDSARSRLIAQEEEARWEEVDLQGELVGRLNALRIETLPIMTSAKRSAILGLSREGFAQLRRELDHLALMGRLFAATRLHGIRLIPSFLRDVFALGSAGLTLLKAVLLLGAIVFLRSRWSAILAGARRLLFEKLRSVRWARWAQALFGVAEVTGWWIVLLAALWLLRRAAPAAMSWPEVETAQRLAVFYVLYRIAIDVSYAVIVKMALRYHIKLDTQRRLLLIRSVRTIIRVVTAIGVLLVLARRMLGEGYLFTLVVEFAWVVVLAAVLRVLAAWRQIIADAYLSASPTGRLAGMVRSSRDHWYGVLVAGASFAWLAGRAGAVLARDFVLTFDQTRRALAFMFRRRMEKHAERQGYADGRIDALPPSLVSAFSEEAASEGPLLVDHFPGMDALGAELERWKGGGGGGSFVVTGEPGMGKTSWLGRVGAEGLPVVTVRLDRHLRSSEDLAAALRPAIGGGVSAGPPRIALVDAAQNLFLAMVGGYRVLEEFLSLMEGSRGRVFWVCSFNAFAWEHLVAVRPELVAFRRLQTLAPWSEDKIRAMIRARVKHSGVALTYEDLVVDRMEGVSAEARFLQTEEGYTRLLWDYADGNPRVALHFWLRSLVAESPTRARVRLFRAPSTDLLTTADERGLFILGAIVTHENLSLDEIVLLVRYPEAVCRMHLGRFVEQGVLSERAGRYRVTTHWDKAVSRHLRRRNLLPD